MKKPYVYLCSRIADEAKQRNVDIADLLSEHFDVFVPHLKEAEYVKHKDPVQIFCLDMVAMEQADLCVVVAPFGKDCACEIGWFQGQDKPIIIIAPDDEKYTPDTEWMISGGIHSIVVASNRHKTKLEKSTKFNYIIKNVNDVCFSKIVYNLYHNTIAPKNIDLQNIKVLSHEEIMNLPPEGSFTNVDQGLTEAHDLRYICPVVKQSKLLTADKLPMELLSVIAMQRTAKVMEFGATKHGANSWRDEPMKWSQPIGAILRHLTDWISGITHDAETGFSNLDHAACQLMFLQEYEAKGLGEDNRYKYKGDKS